MIVAIGLQGARVETTAVSAIELLTERLGRELNVHVTVSPRLARKIVYVERHGAAPETTLRAVADAVSASLVKDSSGYTITRTPQDLSQLLERRNSVRLEWIRAAIKRETEYRANALRGRDLRTAFSAELMRTARQARNFWLKKSDKFPERLPDRLLPAESMLEGLIREIGFSEIAAIPSGVTRVYEDHPVAGAESLPEHALLDAEYAQALESIQGWKPPVVDGLTGDEAAIVGQVREQASAMPGLAADSLPVRRWRLEVKTWDGQINCQLEGFDTTATGKLTRIYLSAHARGLRLAQA